MTEKLQIVDSDDVPTGSATRQEALDRGDRVRMVRVLLIDGHGRVLVQQRGKSVSSYPDRWTDAATGHVNAGEDYQSAAHRELLEELGLEISLNYIGKFSMDECVDTRHKRSVNAVFVGKVPRKSELNLEDGAVSKVRWLTYEALRRKVSEKADEVTPGLVETACRFMGLRRESEVFSVERTFTPQLEFSSS